MDVYQVQLVQLHDNPGPHKVQVGCSKNRLTSLFSQPLTHETLLPGGRLRVLDVFSGIPQATWGPRPPRDSKSAGLSRAAVLTVGQRPLFPLWFGFGRQTQAGSGLSAGRVRSLYLRLTPQKGDHAKILKTSIPERIRFFLSDCYTVRSKTSGRRASTTNTHQRGD